EYSETSEESRSVIGWIFIFLVFVILMIVTKGRILEVLLWAMILSGRGGGGGFGGGNRGGGGFGGFGGFGGGRSGGGGAGGGF
ncbi:MAG: hypothetical protein PHI68_03595, partial [Candidatus Cloacimonetes bacterium]|nr:hypothetical protein [Candidatus Cloacimonadota bacterium]